MQLRTGVVSIVGAVGAMLASGCTDAPPSSVRNLHGDMADGVSIADPDAGSAASDMTSAGNDMGTSAQTSGPDMTPSIPQCPADTGLQPNAPWPMPGHDSAHTNRSTYPGPLGLSVIATAPLSQASFLTGTLAVDADGTLYAGSPDGMTAFTPDLSPLWTVQTGGLSAFAPTVLADGSIVFVASNDNGQGRVYSVTNRGATRWHTDTDAPFVSSNGVGMRGIALGCDGTIYALAGGAHSGPTKSFGQLLALRPDGAISWTFDAATDNIPSPRRSPYNGVIYFGGGPTAVYPNGTLMYQEDPADCDLIDSIEPDGTLISGPATCTPSGTRLWNASSYVAYSGDGAAIGSDSSIYLPGFSSAALSRGGAVLWRTQALLDYADWSFLTSDPALDSSGHLYFVLADSGFSDSGQPNRPPEARLFELDANTGATLATYDFGSYCTPTGIALGKDGRLFVSCGKLYVFG